MQNIFLCKKITIKYYKHIYLHETNEKKTNKQKILHFKAAFLDPGSTSLKIAIRSTIEILLRKKTWMRIVILIKVPPSINEPDLKHCIQSVSEKAEKN